MDNIDKELDETKALLIKNTERLLQRDSHLSDIERNSENLVTNSNIFKRKTNKISFSMYLKKHYCCIIGCLIAVFFIAVFLLIYFSGNSSSNDMM